MRTVGAAAAGKQQASDHRGSHRAQWAHCTAWARTSSNVHGGRRRRPTLVIPGHWVGRVCIVSRYHSGGARLSRGHEVGYTNYVGHLAHRVRLPIVAILLSTGYQP